MAKKQEFVNYVRELMAAAPNVAMSDEAKIYWEAFGQKCEDKPEFTDNGKLILKFLQDNQDTHIWKSKNIADCMSISSRTVSGSLRKLVSDNYVEKVSQDPAVYALTEKGKNIVLN